MQSQNKNIGNKILFSNIEDKKLKLEKASYDQENGENKPLYLCSYSKSHLKDLCHL